MGDIGPKRTVTTMKESGGMIPIGRSSQNTPGGQVQFTDQNKSWDSRDGLHRFNIVRWIQLQNVRRAKDIKRSHSEAEGDSWSRWVETEVPNTDSFGSRAFLVPSQPFWLSTLTKWYGAGRSLWFSSCSLIMFESSKIHGQKRQGFVEAAAFGRRPSHLALHQNSSTCQAPSERLLSLDDAKPIVPCWHHNTNGLAECFACDNLGS